MSQPALKNRIVNQEFLDGLELISNRVYPLPGATFERRGGTDPRLSKLTPMTGITVSDKVTFYDHVATVRHRPTNRLFVAFRQTKDALLIEQSDLKKYPEWLMKSDVKNTELKTHIYTVKVRNGLPVMPTPMTATHEDWLEHIADVWVFDSVCLFLLRNHIISEEMYGKLI